MHVCHYCPECVDEQEMSDIESYSCNICMDTFCYHFMKSKDPYICWVCGSEKRPRNEYNGG